jgi:hypothetical protein
MEPAWEDVIVILPSFLRDHRAHLIVLAILATTAGMVVVARVAPAPAPAAPVAKASAVDEAKALEPAITASSPATAAAAPSARALVPAAGDDAATTVSHLAALRLGLASPDEGARIAAVEAAVSATAIDTLEDLSKFELEADPEVAPTVIHAVALLGASAEGKQRDQAAGTLDRWLHGEMKRQGPDVAGNVSNIVEALGNVGGQSAVDALGNALDRADLALHVETLAVTKLGELGDPRARGPVTRFAKRVGAMPPAEGIDEELRVEAIAAAGATLSKI